MDLKILRKRDKKLARETWVKERENIVRNMQAKDHEGGEAVTEEVWKGSLGSATSLGLLGGPEDFFFCYSTSKVGRKYGQNQPDGKVQGWHREGKDKIKQEGKKL